MGEIADMILDGTLDEETGELIDGESPGWPRNMRTRKGFFDEAGRLPYEMVKVPGVAKVICPVCHKRVKAVGFSQHWRDKHGE